MENEYKWQTPGLTAVFWPVYVYICVSKQWWHRQCIQNDQFSASGYINLSSVMLTYNVPNGLIDTQVQIHLSK